MSDLNSILASDLAALAVSRPRFARNQGGNSTPAGLAHHAASSPPGMSSARMSSLLSGPETVQEGDDEVVLINEPNAVIGVPSGGSPTEKRYRLFFAPQDGRATDEMCGSLIGQGNTFCVRRGCKINHQQKESALIKPGDIFIAKTSSQVFTNPTIPVAALSTELRLRWEVEARSLDDWVTDFDLIAKAMDRAIEEGGMSGTISIAELEVTKDFHTKAQAARTPRKAARTENKTSPSGGQQYEEFSPYKARIGTPESLNNFMQHAPQVASTMRDMDTGLSLTSERLFQLIQEVEEQEGANGWAHKTAEARLDALVAVVGTKPLRLSPVYDAPSLWGSLGSVAAKVDAVEKSFVHYAVFNQFRSEVATLIEEQVKERTGELERRLDQLADYTKQANQKMAEGINEAIADMTQQVDFLASIPAGSNNWADMEDRLLRRVDEVEAKTHKLASNLDQEAVKFGGLGFGSPGQAFAWLDANGPKTFGLLVDFHTVLEHLHHNVTRVDTLSRLQALYKLKITTMTEGTAITSFESLVPKFFSNEKEHRVVKQAESYFDKIPKWDDWDHPVTGYRDRLKSELEAFYQAHQEVLHSSVDASSKFYGIARMSLTETVAFIQAFIVWIDDTYREYEAAKLGDKKAWHVVTRLSKTLMHFIGKPRIGVNNSFRAGEADQISQQIFWAVLRSHDKMTIVREHNFKDMPCVSSELVKFLTINTGMDAIEALKEKYEGVDKFRKEAEKEKVASPWSEGEAYNQKELALTPLSVGGTQEAEPPLTTADFAGRGGPAKDKPSDTAPAPSRLSNLVKEANQSRTDSITRNPETNRADRQVESFLLRALTPQQFAVEAEDAAVWLLAIDRSNCAKLHLPNAKNPQDALRVFGVTNEGVLNALTARLGLSRLTFGATPPTECVWLVSGSAAFLEGWIRRHPKKRALLVITEHWRRRKPPSRHLPWVRLAHTMFGGATNYSTWMMSVGLDIRPIFSKLRRTIGDYINYGLCPTDRQNTTFELTGLDRLNPTQLTTRVKYPSSFHVRGWVARKLEPLELAGVFGFPSWFTSTKQHVWEPWIGCIPVQILEGCLEPLVRSSTTNIAGAVLPTRPLPSVQEHTATWLPELQRYLPHTWLAAGNVTTKAVKSDDADAPTALWDKRVTLPIPLSGVLLSPLRSLLLRRQSRRLTREFCRYLCRVHGSSWPIILSRERAKQAWHQGGNRNTQKQTRKRQRERIELENLDHLAPQDLEKVLQTDTLPISFPELLADADAGAAAIRQWSGSTWWNWTLGSTLLFWRWPAGEQRKAARDGLPPYIQGPLPRNFPTRPPRPPPPDKIPLIVSKLITIIERGYVKQGPVTSLTDFFDVPKGEADIRLVYNGTSSGLNEALWAPRFWLPTPNSALDLLDFGYYNVDLDLGEMFLNFPLPESLRSVSGVELTAFKKELEQLVKALPPEVTVEIDWSKHRLILRWERTWMGVTSSPFSAARFYYWAEEMVRGDPRDKKNLLGWDRVRLNLPGHPNLDPSLPRVMKWRDSTNKLANDLIGFVDDLRATGFSVEVAWLVAHQIASRLQWLGIQDAPRKTRPPDQEPGAWAGAVFTSKANEITKSVSQEKWMKAKRYLVDLLADWKRDPKHAFDFKSLERIRGFLIHLSMTFESMVPYLKGFHLTLASYLPGRDEEGWKMTDRETIANVYHLLEKGRITEEEAERMLHPPQYDPTKTPPAVTGVPRLGSDLEALNKFFEEPSPPKIKVRVSKLLALSYGFVDASGSGLGSTIQRKDGLKIRIGTWGRDESANSSNWREFENLVCTLEDEAQDGALEGSLIIIATDNEVTEGAVYHGTSSSKKLHELVVRLKVLEFKTGCQIIVYHVSGKRMIHQGTDGVSRGHLNQGVTVGESMLSFLPTHQSALERTASLLPWLRSWIGKEMEVLTPEGWFTRGHDHSGWEKAIDTPFKFPVIRPGVFLWTPPPCAARTAIEELRKARIKRQQSTHIIAVPRTATIEWLKQLYKAADILFSVSPGHPAWPEDMFEPLIIAVCFPYLSCRPWELKGTPKMLAVGRKLSKVFREEKLDGRDLLRQFLLDTWRLRTLPADVVWRLLHFQPGSELSREAPGNQGRRGIKRKR